MTQKFDRLFSQHETMLLKLALAEDLGAGDKTSELLIPASATGKAFIIAKQSGVFCGGPIAEEILHLIDPKLQVRFAYEEGARFSRRAKVLTLKGPVRSILKSERVLLNFLGHLCAIAAKTRAFVNRVGKNSVLILDTRKTHPLLRSFEKYAVRTGGGRNHRMGLHDAIFVKENHRIYGDLSKLKSVKNHFEIEVRNMKELKEALELSPRIILFDNFSPDRLHRAVQYARRRNPEVILEASGGMSLENVAHYAAMGIDWISVGSLTHSVESIDFSLLVE